MQPAGVKVIITVILEMNLIAKWSLMTLHVFTFKFEGFKVQTAECLNIAQLHLERSDPMWLNQAARLTSGGIFILGG